MVIGRVLRPLLAMLCCLVVGGLAAQRVAPQVRTIGPQEGLSHHYVWDMAMDQRGQLWVATSNGLNRFDGRHITVYRAGGRAGTLPGDYITSLAADTGRWLYVGCNAPYLTILDVLEDTLYNVPLPIPDFSRHGEQRVTDILIDRQQRVWVAHGARCFSLFDPRTFTFTTVEVAPPLPSPRGREVVALIDEGTDGTLWLSMFKGLVRFDPRTMTPTPVHLHPAPGQPDHAHTFHVRGLVDEDSTLVFGTWSEGIFRMRKRDGQLTLLWPEPTHVPTFVDHMVTDMIRVSDRYAMVACIDQGLLQLDLKTGQVEHFDRSLSEEGCRKQEDFFIGCYRLMQAGDLLVLGSSVRGIAIWDRRQQGVQTVPLPMHDPAEIVDEVIHIERDGTTGMTIALSFRKGLFLHDSSATLQQHIGTTYEAKQGFFDLQQLAADRWLVVGRPRSYEVRIGADRTLDRRPSPSLSCGDAVLWARPDGAHGLWYMTGAGGLFHRDTLTDHCRPIAEVQPQVAALLSTGPWDVFLDSQRRSWFLSSTMPPVVLHPDGRVEQVQGPPSLAPFEVSDICQTPDGRIWLAVKHTGLAMVGPEGPIVVQDRSHGLPSRNVMQVTAMDDNTLWMVVPGALMHWDPATGDGRLLTVREGISSGPLNLDPSHRPVQYPLLVGTWEGFYRIHRSSLDAAPAPVVQLPLVLCMDTVVRRHADRYPEALELPYTADRISILLRTTNLVDPLRDELAYRLAGHTDDWALIGADERITFNSLPHGRYRFEVKARNNGGAWGPVTALMLVVQPPYWATWWFRGSLVVLGLLATWAAFRVVLHYKLREQRRRLEREKALLQERIRIAHDLHDDLGSGLASIGMESELAGMGASDPETRAALLRVSENARNVSDDMRRIIWAMGSGQETLGDLLAYVRGLAGELLDQAGVELQFTQQVSDPGRVLSMEMRRHLVLFTKEALHNVVKHASADRVELVVEERGAMTWTIADDGRGYDVVARDGAGTGTTSMRARAEMMGGRIEVCSAPGQGTRVVLHLPG